MLKTEYHVIGVMSGTSLDGLDLAYIKFTIKETWSFKIEYAETINYNSDWIKILQNLISFNLEKLKQIDSEYTSLLSEMINMFIQKNNIKTIDTVCSHGHTALHQPEKGVAFQIGNMPHLASLINQKLICDFRVQDVGLGGQGAPLVPIGDQLLFSEYNFCLNLGGFANISTEVNSQRIAYDICPVNIVLNHYVSKLGFDYDDKGNIAASGIVSKELLNLLNAIDFYRQSYPKSLGLEWVKDQIFPYINSYNLEVKDILRTYVEHIAVQVSHEINKKSNASVLITGGGVFNVFLISRIKELTINKIIIPSEDIINYKEALIFGFLGVLKLRGEVNCLSSVTGASQDHSSGKIYLP